MDILKSQWANWNKEFKNKKLSSTLKETLKLFQENKDIEKIIKLRNYKKETIEKQIIQLITKSFINIDDIINEDKKKNILKKINDKNLSTLKEIKDKLPKDYTYFEIKCVIGHLNSIPKKII